MKIYKNLNTAFIEELKRIHSDGSLVRSRGSSQKEILFTQIEITDPTQLDIQVPERKFNSRYATIEWLWYLSADPSVTNIGKFAKIWRDIQDDNGEVESNYGNYIFEDQWEWVIGELSSDKDSRRATIAINQPYHKDKNIKDYPCTQYLHFFIRDNQLHMGSYMRSNDVIFGFCNDIFTFCLFQQLMFNELSKTYPELSLGKYSHSAGSLHVYSHHFDMMDSILDIKHEEREYSNAKIFKLRPEVTREYIVDSASFLPSESMTKEKMYEFLDRKTKELFL